MAYSKNFLLVGLVFAIVLLVSSEVSARGLAEATQTKDKFQTDTVKEPNYAERGYLDGHGHHHGHHHGHGHPEEAAAGKTVETTTETTKN